MSAAELKKHRYEAAGVNYNSATLKKRRQWRAQHKGMQEEQAAQSYSVAQPDPYLKYRPCVRRGHNVTLDDGSDSFGYTVIIRAGVWPRELPPLTPYMKKHINMTDMMNRVVKHGIPDLHHAKFPYRALTAIPCHIVKVRSFLLSCPAAVPYLNAREPAPPSYLKDHFKGDRDFFALTILYTQMRLYNIGVHQVRYDGVTRSRHALLVPVANTQAFAPEDKKKARQHLAEYKAYDQFYSNMPEADWHKIPPRICEHPLTTVFRIDPILHPLLAASVSETTKNSTVKAVPNPEPPGASIVKAAPDTDLWHYISPIMS